MSQQSTDKNLDPRSKTVYAIGAIAGRVAHDLSNLLTPLLAYPSLIRRELPGGSRGRELLDIMDETIKDIVRINQQMLAASMRAHTQKQSFLLNEIIQRVMALIEESSPSGLAVAVELAPDLSPVCGSPEQMLRVIHNLCQNAIDAMDGEGKLHLVSRNEQLTEPPADVGEVNFRAGCYVHFSVTDTGPGISPEVVERMYEPFFTTKKNSRRRGSGLGMCIVRDIVGDHEGLLRCDTQLGAGTTFHVYIPAAPAAQVASREPSAADPAVASADPVSAAGPAAATGSAKPAGVIALSETAPAAGAPSIVPCDVRRMIIVDDEENIRRIFGLVIASALPDVQVATAGNGREALEAFCREHHGVIIMDLRMPVMDGREAFQQIEEACRVRNWQMPAVIFCTGFAPPDMIQQVVRDGGRHCLLSKPVRSETLIRQVKARLR